MFIRFVSVLGAVAATAATLAFASPAAAQSEEKSVTVSIADLDPARPADAVRLDRRLHAAARTVCGPDQGNDIRGHVQEMSCEKIAMARAQAQVLLAQRGGGSRTVALTSE